jgi:chemotaxis protein CheZ
MVKRKHHSPLSPTRVNNIGHAVAKLHRLLNDLGHARGLKQSASTMPDARERLSFIDQTMHEASEKTLGAVEHSLQLTEHTRHARQQIVAQLTTADHLAHLPLVQQTLSHLHEVTATEETLRQHLLLIMETQEFRDVAGQMVNKIVDAAVEIEKILLDILREYAPDANDSLINSEGLTAGPNHQTTSPGLKDQDQVDDLLAALGL